MCRMVVLDIFAKLTELHSDDLYGRGPDKPDHPDPPAEYDVDADENCNARGQHSGKCIRKDVVEEESNDKTGDRQDHSEQQKSENDHKKNPIHIFLHCKGFNLVCLTKLLSAPENKTSRGQNFWQPGCPVLVMEEGRTRGFPRLPYDRDGFIVIL